MSNRSLGDSFEMELCETLGRCGFWVHRLTQNHSGQPADIIAVRNGQALLIDCKVCSNGYLPLSRVEENQDLAMTAWKACGNGDGWFALEVGAQVYMIPHITVMAYVNNQSRLSYSEILECGKPLEKWVAKCK